MINQSFISPRQTDDIFMSGFFMSGFLWVDFFMKGHFKLALTGLVSWFMLYDGNLQRSITLLKLSDMNNLLLQKQSKSQNIILFFTITLKVHEYNIKCKYSVTNDQSKRIVDQILKMLMKNNN